MTFKDLFGMQMPDAEHGTIAYHQGYAKFYRRNRLTFLPIVAVSFLMIWINAEEWIGAIGSMLHAALLFFIGARWYAGGREIHRHQALAWQVETNETMQAMARSGLYETPIEIMKALRDGPPAPGIKRKDWERMHDVALADMRAAIERGELPSWVDDPDQ